MAKMVSDALWAGAWELTFVENHAWLQQNRDELSDTGTVRWFTPRGHLWPLLCMTVWSEYPQSPTGVRISISHKESADAWFNDCSLPRALVPALVGMLDVLR